MDCGGSTCARHSWPSPLRTLFQDGRIVHRLIAARTPPRGGSQAPQLSESLTEAREANARECASVWRQYDHAPPEQGRIHRISTRTEEGQRDQVQTDNELYGRRASI